VSQPVSITQRAQYTITNKLPIQTYTFWGSHSAVNIKIMVLLHTTRCSLVDK
jgi:hypothetical protein